MMMTNYESTQEYLSGPATEPNQANYDEQTDDEMPINFANYQQRLTLLITNFAKMSNTANHPRSNHLRYPKVNEDQLPCLESAKYHMNDNEITIELRENVKYHKAAII